MGESCNQYQCPIYVSAFNAYIYANSPSLNETILNHCRTTVSFMFIQDSSRIEAGSKQELKERVITLANAPLCSDKKPCRVLEGY
jgi:hypothetical protein